MRKLLSGVLDRQEGKWEFEGIKASPAVEAYRNKMEFSFGDTYKDGPLSLGMHKRGSFYDIVTVNDCKIVDQDYRSILTYTREYLTEHLFTIGYAMKDTFGICWCGKPQRQGRF